MTKRNETAQPAPLGQVERGVRPRSLKVGQLWRAKFIAHDGEVTTGIYTFKLVHEEEYWCQKAERFRTCFLGVKLYVERNPHGQDHAQCWWFDDRGSCYDSGGQFSFLLTRKKRPNV
jgi:hypothetical protein